jgi:hypothetical protein
MVYPVVAFKVLPSMETYYISVGSSMRKTSTVSSSG